MRLCRIRAHFLHSGAAGAAKDTVGGAHDGGLGEVDGAVLVLRVGLGVLVLAHGHRGWRWHVVDRSGVARVVLFAIGSGSSRRIVVDGVGIVDGHRGVAQVAGAVDGVRSDGLGGRVGRLLRQGRPASALLVRGRAFESRGVVVERAHHGRVLGSGHGLRHGHQGIVVLRHSRVGHGGVQARLLVGNVRGLVVLLLLLVLLAHVVLWRRDGLVAQAALAVVLKVRRDKRRGGRVLHVGGHAAVAGGGVHGAFVVHDGAAALLTRLLHLGGQGRRHGHLLVCWHRRQHFLLRHG